ncbi:Ribosomal protein L11 methyltransferase [termite gut metagenome]|uniref:Ribosomal protein L11 methyltransferase n=1 Tax=termite gut metagenome TaxID=433724 RepID=A0A5J4R6R9_9ZZZZ
MKYLEVTFITVPSSETINDVLSSVLGEVGFESFMEHELGIKAYIPENLFDATAMERAIQDFPLENVQFDYTWQETEDKDWNEEWERNSFQPVVIDNRCVIHSTFHKDVPQVEYNIIINPRMAFGTGYHQTTNLVINALLKNNLKGKSVLDMGCGTSVLAILACMRGAAPVTAIDIDTWCVENSKENVALNGLTGITVELGDVSLLKGKEPFDVIIANINRNVLLNDMKHYASCMKPTSELYTSGFYVEDIPIIREEAEKNKLRFDFYEENNNWAIVKFMLI